jgi:ABC-2 type transport system ATP-binding protein
MTDHIDERERSLGDSTSVVTVRSLTKRFGDIVAVDDLSFSLEAGTVTGFLGPNGAGKTTTLRVLLGLAEPSSGEALVFGGRYRDLDHPARRIGAVLESNDFHPGRTGCNHLRALAAAAEIPFGRVDEVLVLVELEAAADRLVRTYSLGMRQRLGSRPRCSATPSCSYSTSPPTGSIPPASIGCAGSCAGSPSKAERSSSRATCSPRPRFTWTGS